MKAIANKLYNPLNGQTTIVKKMCAGSRQAAEREAKKHISRGWKPYMKCDYPAPNLIQQYGKEVTL